MAGLVDSAHGQCYFEFVSTTQVRLVRKRGKWVTTGGATPLAHEVPAAGLIKSNAGLSADTGYYVYFYDNGGSGDTEFSTTAYADDSATGITVKADDVTRTLVGFVLTDGSSQFQAQGLGTLSWFNRKPVKVENKGTTYGSVSGSFPAGAEVNTAFRQHFVSWADDRPHGYINASAGAQSGSDNVVALARDTTVLEQCYAGTGVAHFGPVGIESSMDGDEADHYITIYAGSSGTVYVNGNQTANQGTTATVAVVVQG